jgi:hypothetical protein
VSVPLVKQFINATPRWLAAVLADRRDQTKLGVDGVVVPHIVEPRRTRER